MLKVLALEDLENSSTIVEGAWLLQFGHDIDYRHKSQKGLAAYERSKSVMQYEVFLFNASGDHDDNEALSKHNDSKFPHNHEALSGHKNPKDCHKIALITGDFVFASLHIRQTDFQELLVNAFDDLEYNQNILEKNGQKDEVKSIKMDGQKKKNKDIEENFKNKVSIKKFLTENTFHN
ncbi:39608_t:CDS:2, partial [Gigaspora margarita]